MYNLLIIYGKSFKNSIQKINKYHYFKTTLDKIAKFIILKIILLVGILKIRKKLCNTDGKK